MSTLKKPKMGQIAKILFLSFCYLQNTWAVVDMPGGPRVHQLTLANPVTQIAQDVHWIHSFLMAICILIFVSVFSVMFYSIFKHRKSKGHKAAKFHESILVEVAWTIVPILIVIGMAFPATKLVVAQKDTSNSDITIKVTGYQWKWGYDYLRGKGEGISFLSTLSTPFSQIDDRAFPNAPVERMSNPSYLMEVDNPLVVPVDRKIRLILTANDVIHSWMVPAFGVKQDAIPGFVRDTWFKAEKIGIYRGQCTELCGKGHSFMPIVVNVKSEDEYTKWVDEKKGNKPKPASEKNSDTNDVSPQNALAEAPQPKNLSASTATTSPVAATSALLSKETLLEQGKKVFSEHCAACHQATGMGLPPAFPALAGSKVVLGPKEEQIQVLLKGRPGTAMVSFKYLSDVDIASVIDYTRNSWGNESVGVDKLIQPSLISSLRN